MHNPKQPFLNPKRPTKSELEAFAKQWPQFMGQIAQSFGVSGRGPVNTLIRRILNVTK